MIASNDSQTLKVMTLHKTNLSNKNAITENLECSNTDLYRRVWKILKILSSFEYFRMEFYRIYRIYRICRKLFLVVLKMKITKNSLLQISYIL